VAVSFITLKPRSDFAVLTAAMFTVLMALAIVGGAEICSFVSRFVSTESLKLLKAISNFNSLFSCANSLSPFTYSESILFYFHIVGES
jgi:hypothetical protein